MALYKFIIIIIIVIIASFPQFILSGSQIMCTLQGGGDTNILIGWGCAASSFKPILLQKCTSFKLFGVIYANQKKNWKTDPLLGIFCEKWDPCLKISCKNQLILPEHPCVSYYVSALPRLWLGCRVKVPVFWPPNQDAWWDMIKWSNDLFLRKLI